MLLNMTLIPGPGNPLDCGLDPCGNRALLALLGRTCGPCPLPYLALDGAQLRAQGCWTGPSAARGAGTGLGWLFLLGSCWPGPAPPALPLFLRWGGRAPGSAASCDEVPRSTPLGRSALEEASGTPSSPRGAAPDAGAEPGELIPEALGIRDSGPESTSGLFLPLSLSSCWAGNQGLMCAGQVPPTR